MDPTKTEEFSNQAGSSSWTTVENGVGVVFFMSSYAMLCLLEHFSEEAKRQQRAGRGGERPYLFHVEPPRPGITPDDSGEDAGEVIRPLSGTG